MILDVSHHNGVVDFTQVAASGVVGVVCKATQGLTYVDPQFEVNRRLAQEAGLLVGAYHFGVGGSTVSPVEQAQHFLEVVDPTPSILVALDVERAPGTPMTLSQTHSFVLTIVEALGRWPVFYAGDYVRSLLQGFDPVLARCPLWLAEYGPRARVMLPTWQTWTLWQWTDGHVGDPPSIRGAGRCDRSRFNGDLFSLRRLWGVEPSANTGRA